MDSAANTPDIARVMCPLDELINAEGPPIMETTLRAHKAAPDNNEPATSEMESAAALGIAMMGSKPLPPGLRNQCICRQSNRFRTAFKGSLPKITKAYIESLYEFPLPSLIRFYRLTRSMSQTTLAYLSGFERSTVSMWEGGHRIPNPDSIRYISDVLRLRHDERLILQVKACGSFMQPAITAESREKMRAAETRAMGKMVPVFICGPTPKVRRRGKPGPEPIPPGFDPGPNCETQS